MAIATMMMTLAIDVSIATIYTLATIIRSTTDRNSNDYNETFYDVIEGSINAHSLRVKRA